MSHQVVLFVSNLAPGSAADCVISIAKQARANNPRADITGLLVFDGEHFAQWIEGPAAPVATVVELMETDPRHTRMEIVHSQVSDGPRRFPSWRLGYLKLDLQEFGPQSLRGKRGHAAVETFNFMLPALDLAVGEAMPAKLARAKG